VTAHAVTAVRGRSFERSRVVAGAGAGVLAVVAFLKVGIGATGLVAAFFVCVLVVLSAIDLERRVLPNRIVLPATAVVLSSHLAFEPERGPEWVVAPVAASLLLFLPLLVYPEGMGMGDVKLALLLGAGLGYDVFAAVALGVVLALPVAVVLLVRGGLAARKTAIPFGPFLAAGSMLVLLLA
jgi:leader peptidase (prepilin peptidase) / N-methyltransferase